MFPKQLSHTHTPPRLRPPPPLRFPFGSIFGECVRFLVEGRTAQPRKCFEGCCVLGSVTAKEDVDMTCWGPGCESGHGRFPFPGDAVSQWETLHPVSNFSQAAEDATLPPLHGLPIPGQVGAATLI